MRTKKVFALATVALSFTIAAPFAQAVVTNADGGIWNYGTNSTTV